MLLESLLPGLFEHAPCALAMVRSIRRFIVQVVPQPYRQAVFLAQLAPTRSEKHMMPFQVDWRSANVAYLFVLHDRFHSLSWFEECFFYRLLVNCDDYGRMDARPAVLKSRLFPLKERIALKDIRDALGKLADIGCVRLYECDGKPYLYLPAWEVHQSIRAKRSKYPAPEDGTTCTHMQADES